MHEVIRQLTLLTQKPKVEIQALHCVMKKLHSIFWMTREIKNWFHINTGEVQKPSASKLSNILRYNYGISNPLCRFCITRFHTSFIGLIFVAHEQFKALKAATKTIFKAQDLFQPDSQQKFTEACKDLSNLLSLKKTDESTSASRKFDKHDLLMRKVKTFSTCQHSKTSEAQGECKFAKHAKSAMQNLRFLGARISDSYTESIIDTAEKMATTAITACDLIIAQCEINNPDNYENFIKTQAQEILKLAKDVMAEKATEVNGSKKSSTDTDAPTPKTVVFFAAQASPPLFNRS